MNPALRRRVFDYYASLREKKPRKVAILIVCQEWGINERTLRRYVAQFS